MKTLTREQAIERIHDIGEVIQVDHLINHYPKPVSKGQRLDGTMCMQEGAINELMAIFDIKEEELK